MSARKLIDAATDIACGVGNRYGGHIYTGADRDTIELGIRRLTAAGYRLIGPGSVEPIDYEKIDIPADIQQFGERNKIPEFASATYRNGYVDGYRFALRSLQGGDGNA